MHDKIFVDFDDTLCLHPHRISSRKYITSPPEYIAEHAYKESVINSALVAWLKRKQTDDKARLYLITSASTFMVAAKKLWIEKNCPELTFTDFIGVSVDTDKTSVIEAYRKIFPDDMRMYYIEDSFSERAKTEKAVDGVIIRSPQWIANI